jgi:hypothetical protein
MEKVTTDPVLKCPNTALKLSTIQHLKLPAKLITILHFITLSNGRNVIKLFTVVIYEFW